MTRAIVIIINDSTKYSMSQRLIMNEQNVPSARDPPNADAGLRRHRPGNSR